MMIDTIFKGHIERNISLKFCLVQRLFNVHLQIYIFKLIKQILGQQKIFIMQVFRKKYLFNPDNPIYESDNVKTYNCMNSQTKDNKLILLKHLKEPPFVDNAPGILQPIQQPTVSDPISVYPLVFCCSEVGQLNEADAMYIIKCLVEAKVKNPEYYIMSPQGICASQVQGLLPNRSPSLFQIAIDLLGIPATLVQSNNSIVSRQAYQICKGIRDNQNVINLVNNYGWANPKKEKDTLKDNQFWIFKGKRKQQGPFGDQYSLAWLSKYGMAKFKYIDLSKDGYEEEFYDDFMKKINFYKQNQQKLVNTVEIFKFVKEPKGIKMFIEILNQGTLTQYIQKRWQTGKALNEKNIIPIIDNFAQSMKNLTEVKKIGAHGALRPSILYVHNDRIVIGQPILVSDKVQKKLRELKSTFDFFAPEMKENIVLPENLFKLSFQKMDIWSFGFMLYKMITRQMPSFDPTRKPILNKGTFSPQMNDLIMRCLSLTPANRPFWKDINVKQLSKAVTVQQVQQIEQRRQVIKLGTRKQTSEKSQKKIQRVSRYQQIQQEQVINISQKKEQQQQKFRPKSQPQEVLAPIPVELSLRLKRIKLIAKIIIIQILYIFVFFRSFLGNSISILLVRSFYGTTSLNLVDNSNNLLSTTTIITDRPNYFLLNEISFDDIQNTYNCINNQFDPIYNPNYSLLTYVQSSSFLALLLTGWVIAIVICITKAISIWKGGISNRPQKAAGKYYLVYGFHELSLASLLFAHFFIYQFFYYASGTPCFSIKRFSGSQPFFDSSLFLFLSNYNGYLNQIFSTLGILSLLVMLSSCYYAWGPKLDQKYFLSIPSILFRLIPYTLLVIICRFGVFTLYSPTLINDSTKLLYKLVTTSAQGFFGIIPEMFIFICIITQLLLQLFFIWCERKAADSDKLARLFNLKHKKVTSLEQSNAHLNDMSLVMQKAAKDDEVFD